MSCFGKSKPNQKTKQEIQFIAPEINRNQKKQKSSDNNQKLMLSSTPLIFNQLLDPRDQKIIFPLNRLYLQKIESLSDSFLEQVAQWLVKVNYFISSRGFRQLIEENLTQNQSKAFTSKNILLNIKQLVSSLIRLKQQEKQILMTKINLIQNDILSEVILKYPQNSYRGASKRIRNVIKKIDNRSNDQYDFLLKHEIVFTYRSDLHYTSDMMLALNKMISFSGDIFIPYRGINDTQDTYFQIWSQLIQYLVINDVKKNQKGFFDGFDFIYNYLNEDGKPFDVLNKNNLKDDLFKKQKEETSPTEADQSMQETHRAKLKINHKIPLQAPLFTQQEIHSGQFKIRNSSVLRVIAKWTFELLEKFRQPKDLILHRAQKFKLTTKKLYSLENNQKIVLYEAISKQRQKIEEYINELKKQYILLETIFAQQKHKQIYQTEDTNIEVYALRIRQIYSQYLFKLLARLIHSLKRVPKDASQIYMDRYQNQLSQQELKTNYQILKQVDLVTFKVGDLIRAKYSCSEADFLRIFKNITEIHQNRPEIMKCIRIKNRLDQKDNDILVNVFFANKTICEIQLAFERPDQQNVQKKKYYTSYNHFLYEIRRSLLGPIGQFACILGQHDPVISQYVLSDKAKNLINDNIYLKSKSQILTHKEIDMPIVEHLPQLQLSTDQILTQKSPPKELKKMLRQINQIYFLCQNCGQLKKNVNFDLLPDRKSQKQTDESQNQKQPLPKQCKECFLIKLQQLQENDRIHYLLDRIFAGRKASCDVFYKHLVSWGVNSIPVRFRKDQLYKYVPNQGFLLGKSSKLISFYYFRKFVDQNSIYLATKDNGKIVVLSTISRILNQEERLIEIISLTKKYFIFKFDENVAIQDGSIINYGKEGEFDAGLCRLQCCRDPVLLGQAIQWKDFKLNIYQQLIKKIFDEQKNVISLSKISIENFINEVIVGQKRYDSACKGINMIQAEQSDLTDIKFTSKMINLSDIYIRYNRNLDSLIGIQNCKHLKILYCNQCTISSITELSGLQLLEQLYINENLLTNLNGLQRCVNLKELSCYKNRVVTLQPIKGCLKMQYLQIGYNLIKSLKPIESFFKLKHLAFSRNDINKLQGIQNLSNLKSIDFSHTNISDLKILNLCLNLSKVTCANTKIQTLQNIQIMNLVQLDLGQCTKIIDFDLSRISCNSLEILFADKCLNMKKLTNLQYCKQLKQLYINQSNSLMSQQFFLIGKCSKLEILNISQNKNLKTLYFLQGIPNISTLMCSKCQNLNNDHFFPIRKCSNLETLNLSYNNYLTSVQFLKGCSKIYHLNLSGTKIKSIDKTLSKFQQLKYLQLRQIKELQIQNFQFLKEAKQIQKIVISDIYDVLSLKGVQKMSTLKELFIMKLQKRNTKRNAKFQEQIANLPIKLQRTIRLEQQQLI